MIIAAITLIGVASIAMAAFFHWAITGHKQALAFAIASAFLAVLLLFFLLY